MKPQHLNCHPGEFYVAEQNKQRGALPFTEKQTAVKALMLMNFSSEKI